MRNHVSPAPRVRIRAERAIRTLPDLFGILELATFAAYAIAPVLE